MASYKFCLALFLTLNITVACSPIQSTNVKYQSQQEVLIELVSAFPKEVVLSGGDAIVAVERLGILFSREFKIKPKVTRSKNGSINSWVVLKDNFSITINKRLIQAGHLFTVDVVAKSASGIQKADLDARNISRFIKTGIFERSLY